MLHYDGSTYIWYSCPCVAIMLCWCVCRDCSCFLVSAAACVFGTYLQSGTCVVSCDNATIGDSDTRECREIQGELAVLVHSSMTLFDMQCVAQMHNLLMAALIICTIFLWQFSKVKLCTICTKNKFKVTTVGSHIDHTCS